MGLLLARFETTLRLCAAPEDAQRDRRPVVGGVLMKKWLALTAAVALVVVGSVALWQLSEDDARRSGALAASREAVVLSWRGVWSEKKEFVPGQVVQFKGAAYVAERGRGELDPWCEDDCREAAENPPPAWCPDDCRWALLAD
jgi:hypothetical protein